MAQDDFYPTPVHVAAADPPSGRARLLMPRRVGLLVLSGLLGAAAFPLAFPIGPRHELFASGVLEPLAFVCLVPLLFAVRGLRTKKAFAAGLIAGFAFFNGTFWWVNVAMTTFGGMPNWLSIPALELLIFYCAFRRLGGADHGRPPRLADGVDGGPGVDGHRASPQLLPLWFPLDEPRLLPGA